jgi:NAD(P)H-hydrate epimerase
MKWKTFLPALTAAQMADVDRAMFSACRLDVLQVMEVAGRAVASWVRQEVFGGICAGKRAVALCGTGGNGGDGLVAARYLQGWGCEAAVVLSGEPPEARATAHQLAVARALGNAIAGPERDLDPSVDVAIDGLLGFGAAGAPRGAVADLIAATAAIAAPIVAIDIPSGLDATTGRRYDPCIRAAATVTLGLPKTGLLAPDARAATGRLIVADIGIPHLAFHAAGIEPPGVVWTADWIEVDLS